MSTYLVAAKERKQVGWALIRIVRLTKDGRAGTFEIVTIKLQCTSADDE